MALFFFHLDGLIRIKNDVGEEFPSEEVAIKHGRRVAWELARNSNPAANIGKSVVVTDEDQRKLIVIPLIGATQPR